jgi:hypothetical protein
VTPRSATHNLDAERTRGRIAGLAALASVASWFAALEFANAAGGRGAAINSGASLGQPTPLNRAHELLDFHAGLGDQTLATAFRCAGLSSIGVLALGYWPGGRPQAWRAVPIAR